MKIVSASAHDEAPRIRATVVLPHLIQKSVHEFGGRKDRKCHTPWRAPENDVFGRDSAPATTGIATVEKQRVWTGEVHLADKFLQGLWT